MKVTQMSDKDSLVAQIVAAYAARPDASVDNIVNLAAKLSVELGEAVSKPASPLGKSTLPHTSSIRSVEHAVTDDKVICLCCGKSFKMLKRHLGAAHNMSEHEYREAFGLGEEIPLVAPNYSERKARYAKSVGFGKYERGTNH